jgi:hypothetical protein
MDGRDVFRRKWGLTIADKKGGITAASCCGLCEGTNKGTDKCEGVDNLTFGQNGLRAKASTCKSLEEEDCIHIQADIVHKESV